MAAHTVAVLPVTVDSPPKAGDDLDHYFCPCDENVSLCGFDITDFPESPDNMPDLCIVCDDLADIHCERCGE